MKLFGGILPFIGYRDEPLRNDQEAAFFELPPGTRVMETFQVEWLWFGLMIPLGPKK
jgi:hypothetical protein